MNAADVYIHNFLRKGREFFRQLPLPYQLKRLAIEYSQAKDAGDVKRMSAVLREAERVQTELER